MNLDQARLNMVEQQIRPWEVLDPAVLQLLGDLPRDAFVPDAYRNLAYADTQIPLAEGQFMMPPREEARMVQSLLLGRRDTVLEIGTGSGYVTTLLSRLSRHVTSVDLFETLTGPASARLEAHAAHNVTVHVGDALHGWDGNAPYDAIAVTGSVQSLTANSASKLASQLKVGGRMFVIVGEDPIMEARLITRAGEHQWNTESLFETVVAPLVGAEAPTPFVL